MLTPTLSLVVLLIAGAPPATAWPTAANGWGGAGPRAVDAAHARTPGSLTVSVGAQAFFAENLLQPSDSDLASYETAGIAWAPLPGFEVGLSAAFLTNTYAWLATVQRQSFGNPAVHLKYGHPVADGWDVGIALHAQAPTAQNSGSVVVSAGSAQAQALLSYLVLPGFELIFNAGYVLDRSSSLASNLSDDARFALNINGNRITAGLAALKEWQVSERVALSPFVELTGYLAPGAPTSDDAALATAGIKALFNDLVELSLGADGRLWGAPQHGSDYAGLPPWRAFALASIRFAGADFASNNGAPPAATPPPVATCQTDAECASGEVCHASHCVLVEVQQAPAPAANPNVPEFFRIAGKVVEAGTGKPIPEAQLHLTGFDHTFLAVDAHNGTFNSWPLPIGGGVLQVQTSAPGYKNDTQVVNRGAANSTTQLTVTLQTSDQQVQGTLRGIFTNAKDGSPVPSALLFLPKLHRRVEVDATGSFTLQLGRGKYEMIISAKGFVTQRRRFTMHDGDVVIINAELQPRRKRGGDDD